MGFNAELNRFRDTANDEEWKKAVDYYEQNGMAAFQKEYSFTFGSIMDQACDKGLYKKKRNYSSAPAPESDHVNESSPKTFIVADQPRGGKPKSTSVQIRPDIEERFNKLAADKGQYTKAAILNQLLGDALALYGY